MSPIPVSIVSLSSPLGEPLATGECKKHFLITWSRECCGKKPGLHEHAIGHGCLSSCLPILDTRSFDGSVMRVSGQGEIFSCSKPLWKTRIWMSDGRSSLTFLSDHPTIPKPIGR